jgi:CopG family nickel-responsive transcriptional regulator
MKIPEMAVISISLDDESALALETIMGSLGIKSRSEAVRFAISTTETTLKDMESITGDVEGVLIIVHPDHNDSWLSMIQHRYDGCIKTQLHSHLHNRRCLDVMIISSDAGSFRSMMRDIYSAGKSSYTQFVHS